ncbi:hypothetical protein BO82DRAFT_432632 [Aspergillus uvarum CBS 121591]|uniref:Uncharacterized protein n=1 Tax=Aspergillus uvarum CBS 121591 TaxID=1448315 RepID=A0A319C616_9EURO|nr:hypothetical protein BO82DRAFT_432632 [Aspergillus uvarum CBS 121591]PYH81276.1 hypothetical protein BO82DRAFT_432632 [Aspergillus uvarum CBS 121591]
MWFNKITVQKAFALASLLLSSGVSAAAIPVEAGSVALADAPETTQISTTVAPVVARAPDCQFCRDDDEDEIIDEDWALSARDFADLPIGARELEPITVPYDVDLSEEASKTTRDVSTPEKRTGTTQTEPKYKKLAEALGKTPEVGKGYAIKIRSERNELSGKNYPDHYLIVVGYVTSRADGSSTLLKFDSACYDIQLEGKKIVMTDRSGTEWYSWDKAKYEVLGFIKQGLNYNSIEHEGQQIVTEMNKKGYNLLTNNCRDFVMKLYKKIKA